MSTGPDPSSVRVPGPWRHRDVSANGIRLHVAECGQGPLVLLAHGFAGFWWSWRHQLPALAEAGFRAVAVDLRGYGDSDKPPRGYDLWTLAGDLGGLVRALGERRADVVGHEWGGWVAWALAALHPRLVRSLAVCAAPHPLALRRAVWADPGGQGRASVRALAFSQLPLLPERAWRADGAARVERTLRARSGRSWPATAGFAEAARRHREAMLIPTVAHCALEYQRWAVRSQARGDGRRFAAALRRPVRPPVLRVHGAEDPYLLARTAAASTRWVAGPEVHRVLPDVGHFPHQEAPELTNALLVAFLRGPVPDG